ncbi:MAG: glycerol-3-phosphate 1-O-acyltransferase PlsY [Burkholderiales bacterium]|jgi:glycerol-3-phosphate acyltransferase PlsY
MDFVLPLCAVCLAYLIGSLSFAVIVSRCLGLSDPRSYGSGNPGATNVLRSGHKGAALLTLLFDALKGVVPVWLAQRCVTLGLFSGETVAGVAIAAFLGHLWPVFFKFKGGKGVATAAGVLLAMNPWLGLATWLTWMLVAATFRYSSLAALIAAGLAPLYQLFMSDFRLQSHTLAVFFISALLVWRHRGNIKKLLQGTESKLGARSSPSSMLVTPPGPSFHSENQPP